jgi:SAM-dependent methyltransferase
MITTHPVQTDPAHFEMIYAEAAGDRTRIPWADGHAHPALVTWLNAVAPSLVRCGGRVAVVGCGLGDDARELMARGYEVLAFDCSETAVAWAKRLDSANAHCYVRADLFNPPARWRRRFDLVVEVNTIHALSPDMHASAMKAIAELLSPRGYLLVICRGGDAPASIDDGPPWAMTKDQLLAAADFAGLTLDRPMDSFLDEEIPPVRRLRAVFRRK